MPGFPFARHLAASFGRADYFNMLRSMSASELDHWFDHYRDRPMHQEVVQWQLAHVIAGTFGGRPGDFIPRYQKPKSTKEQIALWKSV